MISNQIETSTLPAYLSPSPLVEHMERIYRLKPDSGRLYEDFPELVAYHEMSRGLGELIQYIRARDTDPNFNPKKSCKYVVRQLGMILTHFKTRIIRAHVHRHLKFIQTSNTCNTLSDNIAVADAQVLVLEHVFAIVDNSSTNITLQWSYIGGILVNGLESVLKICEEQRTIGYLIYTSMDDGKSPYTPIHPIVETRQETLARLRRYGIID